MAYVPDAACIEAAKAAAGDLATQRDIMDAFERVAAYRDRLTAAGDPVGRDARLRRFAEEEGQRAQIAAAIRRKQAAQNIIVRDKLNESIGYMLQAGLTPRQALLTILEGSPKNIRNARTSVATYRIGYENKYVGGMLAEVQARNPSLIKALGDRKLNADIMTEMWELRQGGKPGSTGNTDAQAIAKTFAKWAEAMRQELNGMGASIGKLDGWAGVQVHDVTKLVKVSPRDWAVRTLRLLDTERTFPDAPTQREAMDILEGIYNTIITGVPNQMTPGEMGQRLGPANLARSLGKSRVLHFKDAASALTYMDEFGYGNTFDNLREHLINGSRNLSLMKVLGPNPQAMFQAVADDLARRVKDSTTISPADKTVLREGLRTDGGALKHALDISTGMQATPENLKWATIGQNIRNFESMAKLGGALFSSIGDPLTSGISGMFRGNGFFRTLAQQFAFAADHSDEGDLLKFLIGEGFDGVIHNVHAAATGVDGRLGATGKLMEQYFRLNGLTWWTDRQRGAAGRVIAAEMGRRTKVEYRSLPERYKHVLKLSGIEEPHWNAIRRAALRQVNGVDYVTGDRIADLPLDAMREIADGELTRARLASKSATDFAAREQRILTAARNDLEMAVRRFIADETNYSVIEIDPRSRRTTTLGTRPGSVAGEALRFVMQFKGWPIAFTQRIIGRQIMGRRTGSWSLDNRAFWAETLPNIGALLASMTLAGYTTMMIKDAIKGYWPPRDPSDPRTIMAAIQQGGAWGIYGDFLFSTTNRFGGGLIETLAGPTAGTFGDLWQASADARDYAVSGGEDPFSASRAFSTLYANTPGANLFWVKPAMDYLWVNSLREMLSPGFLRQQETSRRRDYGQEPWHPYTAFGGR